jgi:uncharacterized membrane protein YraQ (UPF0718 family)
MPALSINLITFILLLYSWQKNKEKTKKAVKIAFKKGLSLAPIMLIIIALIGLLLAFFPPELIKTYLGGDMNAIQVILSAVVGAIVMIPSLIALPLCGSLVDAGASYTPIAAFITTLTMVGFVTLPLELKELGKKVTILRNLLAFIFAVIISILIGVIM